MSIRSILWEEAEWSAGARAAAGGTGAPAFLRGAVRFVGIGFTAMLLTSQVAGIRLVAPVDADPSYCVQAMIDCKALCPKGAGQQTAECVQGCNAVFRGCRTGEGS